MAQVQYTSIAGPLTTAAPLETTAGWFPESQPMPRKAVMATALTVMACVLPATFAQGAVNPPTGWRPTYPNQIARKVVHPARTQAFAWAVLTPGGSASDSGTIIATGSIQFLQYQSYAGAFLDPPSVVSVDWMQATSYPDFVRSRGPHPSLAPSFWMDKWDAPTVAAVTALSWSPRYPDRIPSKTVLAAQQPAYTADTATVPGLFSASNTSWFQRQQDAIARIYPRALYVWAEPHFGVVIDVPVMSWTGVYLDPPVRLKTRPFSAVVNPVDITATPPAPDSSWQGRYPDVVPARPRKLAALTSAPHGLIFVPDVTLVVTAESWQGRYPDLVPGRRRTVEYRAFSVDRFTAPTPVTVPDLAVPVYPDRVYSKARVVEFRRIHMVEGRQDPPPVVPDESWVAKYPDLIWPKAGLRSGLQREFVFWPIPIPTAIVSETDDPLIVPFRIRVMEVEGRQRLLIVPFRPRRIE